MEEVKVSWLRQDRRGKSIPGRGSSMGQGFRVGGDAERSSFGAEGVG